MNIELTAREIAYREANPSKLRVFDVSVDDWRDVSQQDVDQYVRFWFAVQHENHKIEDNRLAMPSMDFRLKIFPNPMRSDGVFVAEDREIEPYQGVTADGRRCYPSVPQKGYRVGHQLPYEFAYELVERWNFVHERKASISGWQETIASIMGGHPEEANVKANLASEKDKIADEIAKGGI